MENILAPKVEALYQAIMELFKEGADINNLTVAEIAKKAGIGKGTVYEYFGNKEEMIAEAIFHHTKQACQRMSDKLKTVKSLHERMNLFLVTMDEEMSDIRCFIRVLQIMLDNSAISSRLRELVTSRDKSEILIEELVREVIGDGIESGGEKEGAEAYLEMVAFSRIICYALYQFKAKERTDIDTTAMREAICSDICRDVENFRAQKQKSGSLAG